MANKGIMGNEIADRAAKAEIKLGVTIQTTQTKVAIKQHVNDLMYDEWNKRRVEQPSCRQTKILYKI